jgi:hypothetical protein
MNFMNFKIHKNPKKKTSRINQEVKLTREHVCSDVVLRSTGTRSLTVSPPRCHDHWSEQDRPPPDFVLGTVAQTSHETRETLSWIV